MDRTRNIGNIKLGTYLISLFLVLAVAGKNPAADESRGGNLVEPSFLEASSAVVPDGEFYEFAQDFLRNSTNRQKREAEFDSDAETSELNTLEKTEASSDSTGSRLDFLARRLIMKEGHGELKTSPQKMSKIFVSMLKSLYHRFGADVVREMGPAQVLVLAGKFVEDMKAKAEVPAPNSPGTSDAKVDKPSAGMMVKSQFKEVCREPSKCNCRQFVSFTGLYREASRVCDEIQDCPMFEDEIGCAVNFTEKNTYNIMSTCGDNPNCVQCPADQLYCAEAGLPDRSCYSMDECCDPKEEVHCKLSGKDEKICLKLDDPNHPNESKIPSKPQGLLHRNIRGSWHVFCASETSSDMLHFLARTVCTLTVGPLPVLRIKETGPVETPGVTFAAFENGEWVIKDRCDGNNVEVQCAEKSCDLTAVSAGQQAEIPLTNSVAERSRRGHMRSMAKGSSPHPTLHRMRRDVSDDRIVGGVPSVRGRFTWLVSLKIVLPSGRTSSCAGTIIHPSWVATAAHCLFHRRGDGTPEKLQNYFVEVAAGLIRKMSASPLTQRVRAAKVFIHAEYAGLTARPGSSSEYLNDIALIKLDAPFTFNLLVNPLCLPQPGAQAPNGLMCQAAGWGRMAERGRTPDHLLETALPIWEPCPFDHVQRNSAIQFCAGPKEGGKDTCQGDSGTALVCWVSGKPVLEGITSHGDGCALPNSPGVYTRVSGFVTWIRDIIKRESEGEFDQPEIQLKPCPGKLCDGGRCVLSWEMCDGKVVHCPATGYDEIEGCKPKSAADVLTITHPVDFRRDPGP